MSVATSIDPKQVHEIIGRHQLADVEGGWRLFRHQVELFLGVGLGVGLSQVLVPVVELASDVTEGD